MRETNFSSMCHIFVISRGLPGHSLLIITFISCMIKFSHLMDRSLCIGGEGGLGDFRGDLKFLSLKKGGPGVIAELWMGGLEILKRSMFKMEKLTL